MVLSAVLGKYSDLAVVSALLVVNAVLSFMQESRAAGVVEALRRRLQVNARVQRDSSWQVIPARELVPATSFVCARGHHPGGRETARGSVDRRPVTLTGESRDADKAPGEVLSSGSVVRRGEGNGVVMRPGEDLLWPHHGACPAGASETSHRSGRGQGRPLAIRYRRPLLCVVVVLSLIRGAPLVEMVPLMLVLLMSAVPVALPVMFTVSMAVGSKELAKRGVLVTRLSAAEDAATMTCSARTRPARSQ